MRGKRKLRSEEWISVIEMRSKPLDIYIYIHILDIYSDYNLKVMASQINLKRRLAYNFCQDLVGLKLHSYKFGWTKVAELHSCELDKRDIHPIWPEYMFGETRLMENYLIFNSFI